jgi:anaerobic selenocysteine-containing dehydrogenase
LGRNPKLRAERGAAALRLHPDTAAAHGLKAGETVRVPIGGVPRRLMVAPSEGVPEGLWLVPTVPDQPVGLYPVDPAGIAREPEPAAAEVA